MPFLTPTQGDLLQERARTFTALPEWPEAIERRWKVSARFRAAVETAGLLDGKPLDRPTLANLIALVREVQNLNPIALPRLLGTYTYYQQFKDFKGTEAEFGAFMAESRSGWDPSSAGHPGADPAVLGKDLAACLSAADGELGPPLYRLLEHPGLGRALATGFLLLWDPANRPIVNNASVGPFRDKTSLLPLTVRERARLRAAGRQRFGLPSGAEYTKTARTLGWMCLLDEVREAVGFQNFFEVDHLMWRLTASAKGDTPASPPDAVKTSGSATTGTLDPEDVVSRALRQYPPERAATRERAATAARELIESKLGQLEEDDIRELLRLFNVDFYRGRPVANRFAPGFVGSLANDLVERLDAVNRWIQALWQAKGDAAVEKTLDDFWSRNELPGAGRSFPSMILHLREPEKYFPLTTGLAKGMQALVGTNPRGRTGRVFLSYCRQLNELRESLGVPAYAADLFLWEAARGVKETTERSTVSLPLSFGGFSRAAFDFMKELAEHNSESWMAEHRIAFREQVREPMRGLVADLGSLFAQSIPLEVEHSPKSPNTLSNIRKNAYGSIDQPYWPHYWAALHRPSRKKTNDFQLFVYLCSDNLRWGLSTGSAPPEDKERFAESLRQHPELTRRAIDEATGAGFEARKGSRELAVGETAGPMEKLPALVGGEALDIEKDLPPEEVAARGADLVRQIASDFRALFPLYALAVADDPEATLSEFWPTIDGGDEPEEDSYDRDQFLEDTGLSEAVLYEIEQLLTQKRQLVLYGPPGTGKTWIAERLARLLAGPGENTELVQFHPTYGYEDFVEGIRPTLEEGTGQLRYTVEPGIFKRLCDRARRKPDDKFVLVVDEINRGNLPRVFGELLYLLERRGTEYKATLPLSKEQFWIPKNVILIGTMNTADQSIALIDVALRRRFHFYGVEPNPELLDAWLEQHAPAMKGLGKLLDRLNAGLLEDGLDGNLLIGHSHFMVADLDDDGLRRVWQRSILPTLEEYFYGKPKKIGRFRFEDFVEGWLTGLSEGGEADDEDEDGGVD